MLYSTLLWAVAEVRTRRLTMHRPLFRVTEQLLLSITSSVALRRSFAPTDFVPDVASTLIPIVRQGYFADGTDTPRTACCSCVSFRRFNVVVINQLRI
jgi:hypothetical protein